MDTRVVKAFQNTIYAYYKKHGRHSLLWRKNITPYKILVSEMMLQQTQVDRVTPKYKAFLKKFPTVQKLAKAQLLEVLQLWSGLGYNRRARFLHEAAKTIVQKYKAKMPSDPEALQALPGIGHYTARAIATLAFNQPHALIETNIRRVYLDSFFKNSTNISDAELFPIIQKTFDVKNPRAWVWALMDYGAYLKTATENPNKKSKHYAIQSKFKGSVREVRGAILRTLLASQIDMTLAQLKKAVTADKRFQSALDGLVKDGILEYKNKKFQVKK